MFVFVQVLMKKLMIFNEVASRSIKWKNARQNENKNWCQNYKSI